MKTIHNYLAQPKFRAWILLPPLAVCVVGVIAAFAQTFGNFYIPKAGPIIFIIGSIWMLLSMWLILWSDFKRGLEKRNLIKLK